MTKDNDIKSKEKNKVSIKNQSKQDTKIIIIEDDEGHADLLTENLKDLGLKNEIIIFDNGQKALDELLNPDSSLYPGYIMVFLDLNLPGLNGWQVLQRMRKNKITENIPVCILTTTENQSEVERCYENGCNMYISKPVDYVDYKDVVNKIATIITSVRVPIIKK